jgi:hypothetical protein
MVIALEPSRSCGWVGQHLLLSLSCRLTASRRRLEVAKPIYFCRFPETLSKAKSFGHVAPFTFQAQSIPVDQLSLATPEIGVVVPDHPRCSLTLERCQETAVQLRRSPLLITGRLEPVGTQRGAYRGADGTSL